METTTALRRIRSGALVIVEKMHRHKQAPVRRTVVRVTKTSRENIRAGSYWYSRSGACNKPGMRSRIVPLTEKVRRALPELMKASAFASEIAELGPDMRQFRELSGIASLRPGDAATYRLRSGDVVRDVVLSVTQRYIYIGAYYFKKEDGQGVNTRGILIFE